MSQLLTRYEGVAKSRTKGRSNGHVKVALSDGREVFVEDVGNDLDTDAPIFIYSLDDLDEISRDRAAQLLEENL